MLAANLAQLLNAKLFSNANLLVSTLATLRIETQFLIRILTILDSLFGRCKAYPLSSNVSFPLSAARQALL